MSELQASSIDATLLDPSQADILNQLLANTSISSEAQFHDKQRRNDTETSQTETSATATRTLPEATTTTTTTVASSAQERVANVARSLEFKIDCLVDGTHRMEQYRQTVERVADQLLSVGAQKLEDRDKALAERSGAGSGGADGGDAMVDTLRSLGRVLHGKGRK